MATDDLLGGGLELDTLAGEQLQLADLLNTVLDKGVILHGDVTLAVADVDLVKLNLGLLLSALETVERSGPLGNRSTSLSSSLANVLGAPVLHPVSSEPEHRGSGIIQPPSVSSARIAESATSGTSINAVAHGLPDRINADAPGIESGLARLVLTLIEVLRKVLEHQAVRRMDGGRLSVVEIERLGLALSKLNDRMDELKKVFGLSDEDLQIDLGPLGRLR
jgi:hypothetical protein